MTSMLKIENMASAAGGEAEGVKENLVMRMMMRLLMRMRVMMMMMTKTKTMMMMMNLTNGSCTSPARLSTTSL